MKTMPYIIIQARLASTRLPNKIILDFHEGRGILEVVVERIKQVVPKDHIIIATSEDNQSKIIQDIAQKSGVNCFAGSENNVLKRFIDAAEEFGAEKIIRICSDNPFLDIQELKRIYDFASECEDKFEYVSFWVDNKPSILTHYGLWTEYTNLKTLKKVASITNDKLYLEHVTNYIHTNRDKFKTEWLEPSITLLESVRLTTDTENDFMNQKLIFKEVINTFGSSFTTNDVMDFLSINKNFLTSMHNEIINNGK